MNRVITEEEVKKHADEKSIWMIIHHNVYDVTKFLDEHPGGADSLLEHAGQDGTQAFEDVAHSSDARELMEQYKIGTLPGEPPQENPKCCRSRGTQCPVESPSTGGSSPLKWALIALAGAIIIGIAYKKYNS